MTRANPFLSFHIWECHTSKNWFRYCLPMAEETSRRGADNIRCFLKLYKLALLFKFATLHMLNSPCPTLLTNNLKYYALFSAPPESSKPTGHFFLTSFSRPHAVVVVDDFCFSFFSQHSSFTSNPKAQISRTEEKHMETVCARSPR